jgi:hypothetical protein
VTVRAGSALIALAALAGFAGVAAGQAPAEGKVVLMPSVAGKQSRLEADLTPQQQSGQQQPRSVVVAITRGFRIDTRSRARRCTSEQAKRFECSERSRIARGWAEVTASGIFFPGGSQDYVISLAGFLAPPVRRGDLAGVVMQAREPKTGMRGTATGRIVRVPAGAFGLELRLDDLGMGRQPPPGVTLQLKRAHLAVAAFRRVRRVRRVRGRRVVRRVRYSLIRNPLGCSGSWPYEVRLAYPGSERVVSGSVPCTKQS